MKQVRITITGVVQGVSFRYFLKEQADLLGVTGWVKNKDNGEVEGLFQGDEASVGKIIKRCLKGPKLAEIQKITMKEVSEPMSQDFIIKRE